MPNDLQEWLALAIVIAVALVGLWRYLATRRSKACDACAAGGCGVNGSAHDEPRVLARPAVKFTRHSPGEP